MKKINVVFLIGILCLSSVLNCTSVFARYENEEHDTLDSTQANSFIDSSETLENTGETIIEPSTEDNIEETKNSDSISEEETQSITKDVLNKSIPESEKENKNVQQQAPAKSAIVESGNFKDNQGGDGAAWEYDDTDTLYIYGGLIGEETATTGGNTISSVLGIGRKGTVKKIVFKDKVISFQGKGFFSDLNNLEIIEGLEKLDTSEIKRMDLMFANLEKLKSVDLSNFDTSKVTDMRVMFTGCKELTNLNLSSFNTSQVTDMEGMFGGCEKLSALDLKNFNTSRVKVMRQMFFECTSLSSLDISGFNTAEVTNMSWMFKRCRSLLSLDLSQFDTSQVESMEDMFRECARLNDLNVMSFYTPKVTSMFGMFGECSQLKKLDVGNFDTSQVKKMDVMFSGDISLEELDVSNFHTENVTGMSSMFQNCRMLNVINVSGFVTTKVTGMRNMFGGCATLRELDLTNFDTSMVKGDYNSDGMLIATNNLRMLKLGPDFKEVVTKLPEVNASGYLNQWQNIGLGTADKPEGDTILTSTELNDQIRNGSFEVDTYVWKPKEAFVHFDLVDTRGIIVGQIEYALDQSKFGEAEVRGFLMDPSYEKALNASGEAKIPEVIQANNMDYKVTTILEGSFQKRLPKNFHTFDLSNIETIGKNSFSENKLSKITVSGKLQNVENEAFSDNEIENIYTEQGLTESLGKKLTQGQLENQHVNQTFIWVKGKDYHAYWYTNSRDRVLKLGESFTLTVANNYDPEARVILDRGKSVTLVNDVTPADLGIPITWYKDKQIISNEDGISYQKNTVTKKDEGKYYAKVENDLHEIDVSVDLKQSIDVTLPKEVVFHATKAGKNVITSRQYRITNNSTDVKLKVSFDGQQDFKVVDNPTKIQLLEENQVPTFENSLKLKLNTLYDDVLKENSATLHEDTMKPMSTFEQLLDKKNGQQPSAMVYQFSGDYEGKLPDKNNLLRMKANIIFHFEAIEP